MPYVLRYERVGSLGPWHSQLWRWLQTPVVVFVAEGCRAPAGYAFFLADYTRGGCWAAPMGINVPLWFCVWTDRWVRGRTLNPPKWAVAQLDAMKRGTERADSAALKQAYETIEDLQQHVRKMEQEKRQNAASVAAADRTVATLKKMLDTTEKALASTKKQQGKDIEKLRAELKAEQERRAKMERAIAINACKPTPN